MHRKTKVESYKAWSKFTPERRAILLGDFRKKLENEGRKKSIRDIQGDLSEDYECDIRTIQRNLNIAYKEAKKAGGRRALIPALLPAVIDPLGSVFDEVYIYRGKIIDKGSSIRIPKFPDIPFTGEYLSSGFDGRIVEATFVDLHPISLETGETLDINTTALRLRLEILDRENPCVVDAYYPIDYQMAENVTMLLPTEFISAETPQPDKDFA